MTYRLEYLLKDANDNQANINNKWVPARPKKLTGIYGLQWRIKDALMVLSGKAGAFTWPEGQ